MKSSLVSQVTLATKPEEFSSFFEVLGIGDGDKNLMANTFMFYFNAAVCGLAAG